jgi:S-adenosylmethionine-diacylgycerolhomoserine-N-methlytransferase
MRVLEIACGTGRNLAKIGQRWRENRLCGLDISSEMLKSARANLGPSAVLGLGDACSFDAKQILGEAQFNRIVLSYSFSMIPDWEGRSITRRACLRRGESSISSISAISRVCPARWRRR